MFYLANCGDYNPYHLLFFMIGCFKTVDNGSSPIPYYYPSEPYCALRESALTHLPARFQRTIGNEPPGIGKYQWVLTRNDFLYVRDLYTSIWASTQRQRGKYTYISRKNSIRRRILNEPEMLDDLITLGFDIIYIEELSFEQQIRLFRESEIITGPHGAAFSFAIFCEPATILYEIYPLFGMKGHFVALAHDCSLRYMRCLDIVSFNKDTEDMVVNKDLYIESLQNLICSLSV